MHSNVYRVNAQSILALFIMMRCYLILEIEQRQIYLKRGHEKNERLSYKSLEWGMPNCLCVGLTLFCGKAVSGRQILSM